MSKGLFQNPKKALLFAGLTLFSVAMLVGSEDDEGALVQAAATLQQTDGRIGGELPPDFSGPAPRQGEFAPDEPADVAMADDDALIDDTAGFDPTPPDDTPDESDPADGDSYIVVDNSDM
ncbi:MAG: hypothetical protein ACO25F_05180 [Erythrobacter sp.]